MNCEAGDLGKQKDLGFTAGIKQLGMQRRETSDDLPSCQGSLVEASCGITV